MTQRPPEAPRRRKLLVHRDVLRVDGRPASHRQLQQRARLVFSQLAAQGMPPQVKGSGPRPGLAAHRPRGQQRAPVLPLVGEGGSPPVKHLALDPLEILVRAVRHHDETHAALDLGGPTSGSRCPARSSRTTGSSPSCCAPSRTPSSRRSGCRVLRGQPGRARPPCPAGRHPRRAGAAQPLYLTHNALLAERARTLRPVRPHFTTPRW
ncbi:MAG: hypothetical protein IPN17_08340 [Deltaproteobacteria bacterium]|nr:hypothetical protein [Deltaproteobacteria bacterium]